MIGACLPNQSALEKHNQEKSPQTFAHLVDVSAMFDYRKINLSHLADLGSVLCSRDLDLLRAQRIIAFLNFDYPQINEVTKSDHMDNL